MHYPLAKGDKAIIDDLERLIARHYHHLARRRRPTHWLVLTENSLPGEWWGEKFPGDAPVKVPKPTSSLPPGRKLRPRVGAGPNAC